MKISVSAIEIGSLPASVLNVITRLLSKISTFDTIPSLMKPVASIVAITLSPFVKLIFLLSESYFTLSKNLEVKTFTSCLV